MTVPGRNARDRENEDRDRENPDTKMDRKWIKMDNRKEEGHEI